MYTRYMTIFIFAWIFTASCNSKSSRQELTDGSPKVSFEENVADEYIEVRIDGRPFTTFRWHDDLTKPILYPIFTSDGTEITRGFPIQPKAGERADHPHQIGMWLTYGDVNGSDFWGNGSKGLGTKNPRGGVIWHQKVDQILEGTGEGKLVTSENWVDSTGHGVLQEQTIYHFIARDPIRIIDRITTLTATSNDVAMPDTKEGMFGIRVARQLELPAEGEVTLYNATGHTEKVMATDSDKVSGNYRSSEGVTGLDVWGTRARWMILSGNIEGKNISIAICDHPDNPNYPTWWHARGYGLFAANPLGAKDFTQDRESVNFSILTGTSATFRYRMVISSGVHLTDQDINTYADAFAGKY